MRYVGSHPYGHPEWTLLRFWESNKFYPGMDSMSWFAGGNFILGGMVTGNRTLVNFGLSIADTAGAIYSRTATGLGGEFLWWTPDCAPAWGEASCTADNSFRFSTTSFRLRPEALESWYYAYRATRDRKYRDWAWKMFKAMEKYCKTPTGYSSISDVTVPSGGKKMDMQESFLFAEIFKYLYLMYLEVCTFPNLRMRVTLTWGIRTTPCPTKSRTAGPGRTTSGSSTPKLTPCEWLGRPSEYIMELRDDSCSFIHLSDISRTVRLDLSQLSRI